MTESPQASNRKWFARFNQALGEKELEAVRLWLNRGTRFEANLGWSPSRCAMDSKARLARAAARFLFPMSHLSS